MADDNGNNEKQYEPFGNGGAPMNDGERNELMAQINQLNADKEAMRGEFSVDSNDPSVKTIRDKLANRGADIIDGIISDALFSESPTVRSKNSIWCAEVLLGIRAPAAADDDQFKKLLTELKDTTANHQSDQESNK